MGVPISNVTRRVVYAASGTGPYNFTFEILTATDIAVYRDNTLLTLTTNYTVTINANGTVTADYKKSIPGAYPLGTTSYGLAYSSGKNADTQKLVAEWFTYVLDKCPSKYPEKGFSQITGPLYNKSKEQIAKIK